MYSRYIPNEQGGFDRRRVPEPTNGGGKQTGDGARQSADSRQQRPQSAPGGHDPPPRPAGPPAQPQRSPAAPGPAVPGAFRPGPGRPRPGPPPGMRPGGFQLPGALFGSGGLLGGLLPRGLDADDLLILAVLLLAMRQDGAAGTELLLAGVLYLLL